MTKTIFYLLCFVVFNDCIAQKQSKLSDIKISTNLDSIEQEIKKTRIKDTHYLNLIITLEWSKLQIRSGNYGAYYEEITKYSKVLQNPLGEAFIAYAKVSSSLQPGFSVNHYSLAQAKHAANLFKKNKDIEGLFFSYALLARLYATKLNDGHYSDTTKVAQEKNENLMYIEKYNNSVDSLCLLINKKTITTFATLQKSKTYTTLHQYDRNYTEAKEALKQLIVNIEHGDNIYTPISYYFLSNIYALEDSFEKAAALEKIALRTTHISQKELILSLLISIANNYNSANIIDSSLIYCRKAFEFQKNLTNVNIYELLTLYENFVLNFEEKNQIDSALVYSERLKLAMNRYFIKLKEYDKVNFEFNTQEAIEKEQTLQKYKFNMLFIRVTLVILFLLILILLYVYRIQKKIKKAYLEIERLQQQRQKFYSIISHDLRSPLISYQFLASSISYWIKKGDFSMIEEISQKIESSSTHLQLMLDNLMKWSLEEQNNLYYKKEEFCIGKYIADTLHYYEHFAESKKLHIKNQVDNHTTIFVDSNSFQIIFRNLLDNSIKNAPNNTEVFIEYIAYKDNVELKISNQLLQKNRNAVQLIKSFFQSERNWQPGENGIGLGLVLIKEFSKKIDASIIVDEHDEDYISFTLKIN